MLIQYTIGRLISILQKPNKAKKKKIIEQKNRTKKNKKKIKESLYILTDLRNERTKEMVVVKEYRLAIVVIWYIQRYDHDESSLE